MNDSLVLRGREIGNNGKMEKEMELKTFFFTKYSKLLKLKMCLLFYLFIFLYFFYLPVCGFIYSYFLNFFELTYLFVNVFLLVFPHLLICSFLLMYVLRLHTWPLPATCHAFTLLPTFFVLFNKKRRKYQEFISPVRCAHLLAIYLRRLIKYKVHV